MISKQKRNLINELSFWIIQEVEQINNIDKFTSLEKKTNIKTLLNIVKSSKDYTNKQIKELIKELKYQLPF
tara:strand:+ start:635 stop:847 length:213 start_codon:yes stop_codon:yes gene_type:complete